MTAQLTPDKTFPTKTIVPGSWFTDLQTDRKTIARCFYDEATPDLPLAEQKKGTVWGDPTVGVLRYFRIDGAGDSRVSSPLRSVWIPSDQSPAGLPPIDGRVKEGDAYLADDGTDSYVAYYNATLARFWARGIVAEYRTAATSGSKKQHSQLVRMRASSWGGVAKDRDWLWQSFVYTEADSSDVWEARLSYAGTGITTRSVVRVRSDGTVQIQGVGGNPALLAFDTDLDATHIQTQVGGIGTSSFAPDLAQLNFVHGDATKRFSLRMLNPTATRLGIDAMGIQWLPTTSVDGGESMLPSPSSVWTAAAKPSSTFNLHSFYAQHQLDATTPTGRLRFGNDYGPGTLDLHHYGRLALAGTTTLSGALGDGDAAQVTLTPTYSGAHTVSRHSYRKLVNPTLASSAVVTDACRDHYDAAAGTHKALDSATGGAAAWEKVNEAGTVLYGPLFTTKNLGIPTQACGEISLTDGADAQTITDVDEWQPLEGFDTEGLEVGVTLDSVNSAITPDAAAKFAATLSVSFTGDAAEYVFAVARITPGPSPTIHEVGRQARVTVVSTEVASVCVECLFDVGSGQALVPLVKTPTGSAVDFTLAEAALVAVKVAD